MEIPEIIEYWKQSAIELNQGVNLEHIEMLEQKINFKFPQTFKEFYLSINGFKNDDWNEQMFTIYPIDRIALEYTESKHKMFIPFCDYLINSHQIGFNRDDKKIYIDYRLDKWHNDKVADTFEQSLVEIINDTEKIY